MKTLLCDLCGKKRHCRHLVLIDYSQDGGWLEDGVYCTECEQKIVNFMTGDE